MDTVLFACVHNAGRSQMAALLTEHLGGGRVSVRSAGSDPADRVSKTRAWTSRRHGWNAKATT